MICNGCKQVQYCGAGCQKLHWRLEHRRFCRALAERAAAAAAAAAVTDPHNAAKPAPTPSTARAAEVEG